MSSARRLLLLTALAVVALAGVATAGTLAPQIRLAKDKGGPYAESPLDLHVGAGHQKSAFVRVKNLNKSDMNLSLTAAIFQGPGNQGTITARWFKGKREITGKVRNDGYEFGLAAGKKRVFRAEIHAKKAKDACVIPTVHYGGNGESSGIIEVNGANCVN
jgi:hypothetical protein